MINIERMSEIRCQNSDVGNQKTENRSQKIDIRKIYFTYFLSSVLCLLSSGCYAQQGTLTAIKESFYKANVYYEKANYDEAIKQYNSILESGLESGNLYYNLGNCYFKKGKLGKTLLNYEKARRLIPQDKDLESNYEYASSLIKGQTVVSKKSLPLKILNNLFEWFTIDDLTILLSALYILVLIGIMISFFVRPFKKHALIFATFLGLFFIAGLASLRREIALLNKEAIVIVEQADAKFEPMDKATTYFTLYEGMKVEVISSKDNWRKIRRQDNKSGWVENSALDIF